MTYIIFKWYNWLIYIHLVVYFYETLLRELFINVIGRTLPLSQKAIVQLFLLPLSCLVNLSKLCNLSVSSSLKWWINTKFRGKIKQEEAYYNLYSPFSTFPLPYFSLTISHLMSVQPFLFISVSIPNPYSILFFMNFRS